MVGESPDGDREAFLTATHRRHGLQNGFAAGLDAGAQVKSWLLPGRAAKGGPALHAKVQASELMTPKAEDVPPSHSSSLETPQVQSTAAPVKI